MLFLGRQQETERTAENVQIQLFWAKKLCPGRGRRAGHGCERGKAAGSASRGHGEGRGSQRCQTPLREFIAMGKLPEPSCLPRARRPGFYWSHWDRLKRTDRT